MTLQCCPGPARKLNRLAQLQSVEAGDHYLGVFEIAHHVRRGQAAVAVVGRVVGQQDPQPIADGDARRYGKERPREGFRVGAAGGVDRLPGDEHCHHGCLAGSSGEFQREAEQIGIGALVGLASANRGSAGRGPALGATSASQIAVSTASTWQKNGRSLVPDREPEGIWRILVAIGLAALAICASLF
jgi:hypothetical protein